MLAAKLNIASGADAAVADAVAAADAFLAEHSWDDWASLTSVDQQMVLSWMTTFDEFNNGLAGPEHCDDTGALAPEASGEAQAVEEPVTEAACVLPVDRHPVAACIAERYGVSYQTVLEQHFCEHQGFGNIERGYAEDDSQLPCMSQGNGSGGQGQGGQPDNSEHGQGQNNPPGQDKPDKPGGKK
jgi:hypothetical protein